VPGRQISRVLDTCEAATKRPRVVLATPPSTSSARWSCSPSGSPTVPRGPLYAVLSVGPDWDWTTMSGLYPELGVYVAQLRKSERFVRAYHSLTRGNTDAAVARLKQVVARAPEDNPSARLVKQFSRPGSEADPPPPPPTPATRASTKPGQLPGGGTSA
jgi:hypothetical protein